MAILAESLPNNAFRLSLINESGLYACIFGSTKSEAKAFKKFVTSEILPTIRKTGNYSVNKQPSLPSNYLEALESLVASEKEKLLLKEQAETQKLLLEQQQPKINFINAVFDIDNPIDMAQAAKLLKLRINNRLIGRNTLFRILRELEILQDNNNPYQQFITQEYFQLIQVVKNGYIHPTTLVTQRGLYFLNERVGNYLKTEE